jgi:serine/threonine protein kinase
MDKNGPVSPWAFDLFRNLIELDPGQRLSATQALEHEYFRGNLLVIDGATSSSTAKFENGMDSPTLYELQPLLQPCQEGTQQPSQQMVGSALRDRDDIIFDLGAAKRRRLIALGR